jgi:hypothetical protein
MNRCSSDEIPRLQSPVARVLVESTLIQNAQLSSRSGDSPLRGWRLCLFLALWVGCDADLPPTLIDLAGLPPLPAADGESVADVLSSGGDLEQRKAPLFVHLEDVDKQALRAMGYLGDDG